MSDLAGGFKVIGVPFEYLRHQHFFGPRVGPDEGRVGEHPLSMGSQLGIEAGAA